MPNNYTVVGFIRPDRQQAFNGTPSHEWPEPAHDRDTITVDRIGGNENGDHHRFTIQRGDHVSVWFRKDRQETGAVTGISLANSEVKVRGVWHPVGCIYPAVEPDQAKPAGVPLSQIINQANQANGDELTEADRVPEP